MIERTQDPQPAPPVAPVQFIMFSPLHLWVLRREPPAVSVHAGVSEDKITPGVEHVRPFVMMNVRLKFISVCAVWY